MAKKKKKVEEKDKKFVSARTRTFSDVDMLRIFCNHLTVFEKAKFLKEILRVDCLDGLPDPCEAVDLAHEEALDNLVELKKIAQDYIDVVQRTIDTGIEKLEKLRGEGRGKVDEFISVSDVIINDIDESVNSFDIGINREEVSAKIDGVLIDYIDNDLIRSEIVAVVADNVIDPINVAMGDGLNGVKDIILEGTGKVRGFVDEVKKYIDNVDIVLKEHIETLRALSDLNKDDKVKQLFEEAINEVKLLVKEWIGVCGDGKKSKKDSGSGKKKKGKAKS